MVKGNEMIGLPETINPHEWIDRWDRMQERYLPFRAERFQVIMETIGAARDVPECIVDLGCGTGTLTRLLLERFPTAKICGIDFDPTLLPLAQARTSRFSARVLYREKDLRLGSWADDVPGHADAVVSATALHWLGERELESLYRRIAAILKPGGVFFNADHVGSDSAAIQRFWKLGRDQNSTAPVHRDSDDWDTFWNEYLGALGPAAAAARAQAMGTWEGIEAGLPLVWHLDRLRECGFSSVDCFWRNGGDAVYGGVWPIG
jgi:SAM-dependent methyltransferase